jgi:hypothetical protein
MVQRKLGRYLLPIALVLLTVPMVAADASSSAPDRHSADADTRSDAAAPTASGGRNDYGIPPLPYDPPKNLDGWEGKAATTAGAAKLKTTVALPGTRLLGYLRLCTEVIDSGSSDPASCPAFHPPSTSFDSLLDPYFPIWLLTDGRVWVESPRNSKLRYGTFAPVQVKTLAFGSIPATATLHVTQPVNPDGFVAPLRLTYLQDANTLPPSGGVVTANKRWPGFSFPANDGAQYATQYFSVTGPVDVRLSKVEIDGRPIDVGTRCHTERPGRITLGSPTGPYSVFASASSLKGRPGGAQVLNVNGAGSAQGAVSIPAFSGCGNGSEDLDPLVTALVSGSGNPVDVDFTEPFYQCTSTQKPEPCAEYPQDPPPNADVAPRMTTSRHAAGSTPWTRLSAAQRGRLATAIDHLPRARKELVLQGLPLAIAAGIRAAQP